MLVLDMSYGTKSRKILGPETKWSICKPSLVMEIGCRHLALNTRSLMWCSARNCIEESRLGSLYVYDWWFPIADLIIPLFFGKSCGIELMVDEDVGAIRIIESSKSSVWKRCARWWDLWVAAFVRICHDQSTVFDPDIDVSLVCSEKQQVVEILRRSNIGFSRTSRCAS